MFIKESNLKSILIICSTIILIVTTGNATSFSKSKKILVKKIYNDNQITFYCSNPYELKKIKICLY